MTKVTVYRGVVLSRKQIGLLKVHINHSISTRSHAWWARTPGIAATYATTPSVRERSLSEELLPVLLTAELENPPMIFSPTLPDLRAYPAAKLKLLSIEVLR